jgi:hypothetical protein
MKRLLVLACVLLIATGCTTVTKRFSVVVEPPDAEITVISGGDQPEQKFRSPADITVSIPKDPDLAARSRMEVRREAYKPKIVGLAGIEEGHVVTIKLEKAVHYRLTFRLISPALSEDLRYRDRIVSVAFTVGERQFEMNLENLTRKDLKILWDRTEYTDFVNRQHRLMHSGVRPQDRNNPVAPQAVPAGGSLQQAVMPTSAIVYSREKKAYETKPLFPLDSDTALALKGRTFYLFLPIEMDRQIIPYNFKFQITDVIKE